VERGPSSPLCVLVFVSACRRRPSFGGGTKCTAPRRSFLSTTVIRRRRRVHMWYRRAGACVRGRRSILLCWVVVVRPQPKGEDGCNRDDVGWRGGGIGCDERVTSEAARRRLARQRRARRLCNSGRGDAMFSFRRASLIYLFFLLPIICKTFPTRL